jgi:tRNA-dihydrouridine synthase A
MVVATIGRLVLLFACFALRASGFTMNFGLHRMVQKKTHCVTTVRRLAMTSDVEFQHKLAVAPMMEYTDRHQRTLQRLMSRKTVLYTEMVTTNALVRSGTPERFLQADLPTENPVVLQLGGSDPVQMKEASKLAAEYGYQEINLNIGCPSEKVSGAGCFGAVLYLNPKLVSELALAVGEGSGKPATVKCRIGVDGHETYEELCQFIRTVSEVGKVTHFIIHARIAVLGAKFTPKDNRTIPPLKYEVVYKLIKDFPHLNFSLNGGVGSIETVTEMLAKEPKLHGVMVGRAVVNDPYAWSTADSVLYNSVDPG